MNIFHICAYVKGKFEKFITVNFDFARKNLRASP